MPIIYSLTGTPMDVAGYKTPTLMPTVGLSSRLLGEFEGHYQKNQAARRVRSIEPKTKLSTKFFLLSVNMQDRIRIKAESSTTNWIPMSL
jgi:hypothetical protein